MHAAWPESLAVFAPRKHVQRYEFATFIGALHKARWHEGEYSRMKQNVLNVLGPNSLGAWCIITRTIDNIKDYREKITEKKLKRDLLKELNPFFLERRSNAILGSRVNLKCIVRSSNVNECNARSRRNEQHSISRPVDVSFISTSWNVY